MVKTINPILKPENRDELIQSSIKRIDELQTKTINEAYKFISNPIEFEKNIHSKFKSYLQTRV